MCSFIHWRLNKELSNTDWFLPKQILDPETVGQLRDHVRVYIDFTGGGNFSGAFFAQVILRVSYQKRQLEGFRFSPWIHVRQ